ncbi:MAG: Spc7 kinetochore protein-domain-containing protein [Linnemannia gamsii]|nr:MAG: Spc7 kinetochore protein-domain-containing protein [Linnemannia gamsii]
MDENIPPQEPEQADAFQQDTATTVVAIVEPVAVAWTASSEAVTTTTTTTITSNSTIVATKELTREQSPQNEQQVQQELKEQQQEQLQQQQQEQQQQGSIPQKRPIPEKEEPDHSGEDESPVPESAPDKNEDGHERESSPPSPKKRRISIPGKSILKSAGTEDEGDLTGNQEPPEAPAAVDNGELSGVDITETFSSTTEFLKRSRKSIGRRVSFAATARIRMFERDEKEDEHAKTMSFIEGPNPQVTPNNALFTFQSGSQDNATNNTAGAMDISKTGQDAQDEGSTQHTHTSNGSSDSEKERSFEVSIAHGLSDSAGSSGENVNMYLQSLLPTEGLGKFGDDMGHASDSSSDEDVNYFPDAHLMKRSSGVGIYENNQDDSLGPQVQIGQPSTSHFTQPPNHLDDLAAGDMTDDFSMDFKFHKHRSSLPERLPTPIGGGDKAEDSTADFTNDHRPIAAIAGSFSTIQSHELSEFGSIADIMSEANAAAAKQGLQMLDDPIPGDEDTDMDITAPIGSGIQDLLVQELPPTAFHSAEDHTAMFSDSGMPMDMTQPIGEGIVESFESVPSSQIGTAAQAEEANDTTNTHAVHSTENNPVHTNDKNNDAGDTIGSHTRRSHSGVNDDSLHESAGPRANKMPATPYRQSFNIRASLRASFGATDVGREPSLEVPTEGSEQLQRNTPHPSFNEPIYPVPPVSPATTNLNKKIHRFSVGEPSVQAGESQGEAQDGQDNTLDFLFDQNRARRSGMGISMDSGNISQDHTNDYTNDFTPAAHEIETNPEADASYDSGGGDDSIIELPPISMPQFLNLVGITFLDQLNTSTRRRTIPHLTSSSESYRSADLIKAKAIFTQELDLYRDACRLLKQSIETSRKHVDEQEKNIMESNPDYFREFRESNADIKEFMKDRLKMIKSHAKLETSVEISALKSGLMERQQASLEEHLDKLKKDVSSLGQLSSEMSKEQTKVSPRFVEVKEIFDQATQRRRAYAMCDKDQLRMLTEAVDEQGTQIEHFKSINERKEKELAEIRARVAQLRLSEQSSKARVATAEKTIQDNQYVRPEDLSQAKDRLSIIQATHRWEPRRLPTTSTPSSLSSASGSAFMVAKAVSADGTLEFVYDKTVVVAIEPSKIGKDLAAVKVSAFEEEPVVDFDLTLADRQLLHISALTKKARPAMKEYFPLLRDYTSMIAAKYKTGTTIGKILGDVSQFWSRICLIRRDIELVRAHHVVDIVAGSAENLKELEILQSPQNNNKRQVAGSTTTPIVLLDVRIRFTGPIVGARRGAPRVPDQSNSGHRLPEEEPVKFYLWFTFTLSDLLSFPGPNSFTWRLELVYGDISHDHVAQAVGPCVKKGGYDVMRDICVKVNQLLRT